MIRKGFDKSELDSINATLEFTNSIGIIDLKSIGLMKEDSYLLTDSGFKAILNKLIAEAESIEIERETIKSQKPSSKPKL